MQTFSTMVGANTLLLTKEGYRSVADLAKVDSRVQVNDSTSVLVQQVNRRTPLVQITTKEGLQVVVEPTAHLVVKPSLLEAPIERIAAASLYPNCWIEVDNKPLGVRLKSNLVLARFLGANLPKSGSKFHMSAKSLNSHEEQSILDFLLNSSEAALIAFLDGLATNLEKGKLHVEIASDHIEFLRSLQILYFKLGVRMNLVEEEHGGKLYYGPNKLSVEPRWTQVVAVEELEPTRPVYSLTSSTDKARFILNGIICDYKEG